MQQKKIKKLINYKKLKQQKRTLKNFTYVFYYNVSKMLEILNKNKILNTKLFVTSFVTWCDAATSYDTLVKIIWRVYHLKKLIGI